MIYSLPSPIRGNPDVRITSIREVPGSGVVVHFQVGENTADGFVADRLIPEIKRFLVKPEADAVRGRAAEAGRPVTAGGQEWHYTDLLAELDAKGWEP